ncbi:N-carbamoylputrescine amidase [Tistrella bauzanensis]|jgi:N-carbamoylputrescine amidase|uniref:N-carbamoylputrescine amidase n=2 Tax=Tistrella TaxID=171436 RepID=A0ABU9YMI0_9PROT|nr:N-carbamoylputrescine amidase [Tistrella bauzanensis]GGB40394.1 N-carbamoylputrescine amidase [Tistrella bauzanensis]
MSEGHLTVAALQMQVEDDRDRNLDRVEDMVRAAAAAGARLVLPQELFELPYFCKDQDPAWFETARPFRDNPAIIRMQALAAELGVVIPVSFFERAGPAFFNSLAMIDADGRVLGLYRKSHIPDGPGYQEKFYFSPGDTGFMVFDTAIGRVGAAICWDQWFPEAARSMALMGADILLYPTAIGSEPQAPDWDSRDHWRRVMQGHAAANIVPVVATNRVGTEVGREATLTFYGSSFVTDATGGIVAEAGRTGDAVVVAEIDLAAARALRASWGLFRDRRPDLYGAVATLDGGIGGKRGG